MSAKLQFHRYAADRTASAAKTTNERLEAALACIRQAQADAEQICTDAADIEDARFIAENIVATCRHALAGRRGPEARGDGPAQRQPGLVLAPALPDQPNDAKKAAARARLDALSARELEIFTHLAEGRSASEIAVMLSRSSKTINNHRTRILQKLGLKNATELVRLAVHSGLVSF